VRARRYVFLWTLHTYFSSLTVPWHQGNQCKIASPLFLRAGRCPLPLPRRFRPHPLPLPSRTRILLSLLDSTQLYQRQRSAGSADGATVTQAASAIEADIGSTDWFDGSLFNTEGTEVDGEHRGRDDLAGICRDFWPGQSLPRLNRGGKSKLVGGVTTRTIAAKSEGTKASLPSQAAGPCIRGDPLRALAIFSGFWMRQIIGRWRSRRSDFLMRRFHADRCFHF
jgi:hypothetical protein